MTEPVSEGNVNVGTEPKEKTPEKTDQQVELMACLRLLLAEFGNYGEPRLRTDGDIVIPLDPVLKQNRVAYRGMADAFSEMMKNDVKPRRSQTWVD